MIDTGVYFPLRVFHHSEGMPEFSPNRFECADFDHSEYFWCPNEYLLPFQVKGIALSSTATIVNLCTGEELSKNISLHAETIDGNIYRSFHGGTVSGMRNGTYQLVFDGQAYSDPFIVGDTDGMIHLKFRDEGLRGDFYWRDGLYGECYIDTIMEKPSYPIQEDAHQDQAGETHRMFQRWEKRHVFAFRGVESMADAMSVLPLMQEVVINGIRVFDVLVDIRWDDEEDCLANIEVSFLKNKIIKAY